MPDGGRLLLAIDFGLKRIGIASANELTRTASPVTTLAANGEPPWAAIDALIAEWRPSLIVVGQPGPGADESLAAALERFVATLEERYAIAVESVDESFTSTTAAETLRAERRRGNYNRRLTRDRIDRHAACLIAEQWMNQALERN